MMLNDLPPLPAWTVPKQQKIKQQEPLDRREIFVGVFRAISDKRLTGGEFRVLMAICSFANKAGMAWPGLERISQMVNMTVPNVCRCTKTLIDLKYLRLVSKGNSRAARATCYQVLRREDAPEPLDAIAIASDRNTTEDLTPPHLKGTKLTDNQKAENSKRIRALRKKLDSKPVGNSSHDLPPAASDEAPRLAVHGNDQLLQEANQLHIEQINTNVNYLLVYRSLWITICKRQPLTNENDQAAATELASLGVDGGEFASLVEADLRWRIEGSKPLPASLAFYLPTFRKLAAP